jgi:hypothetical protein
MTSRPSDAAWSPEERYHSRAATRDEWAFVPHGAGYTNPPMRILHDGFSALRLIDDHGRFVLIDPNDDAAFADVNGTVAAAVVVTGGPWAERYAGAALLADRTTLVADAAVIEALGGRGAPPPATVDGFSFEALAYTPAEPRSGGRDRVAAAVLNPRWALGRLAARNKLPDAPPVALRIGVADGHELVHLGLSLHRDTPPEWIAEVAPWCEGRTVVAGYPHGDGEVFVAHVLALKPRRLLLCDQSNDVRRAAGLPTELVTPVRDVLVARGLETHPFVSGTSVRFERDDTIKRW